MMKKYWLISAVIVLGACGSDAPDPAVAADPVTPSSESVAASGSVSKPGAPYGIDYRIIGTPIVGSPVTIELTVRSTLGPRPVTMDYRINDAGAMMLAEAQPARVFLEPADNEAAMRQQVTVVPMREGRLYLNVSAAFQTDEGTMSTVTAIPVQVGTGTRQLEENGRVEIDANGDAVRVIDVDGS